MSIEKYEIAEELGRGAFSIVKLAIDKETKEKFAVKIINKTTIGQDMGRLATEIAILKQVNHPNIIALKETIDTKNCLFIITEYVSGGELFDRIVQLGSYSETKAATVIRKMVSAIDYLHKEGIVHRDLKPENLLLKDNKDDTEIKIADFGLSKIVSSKVMMQTACGTPGYVAPEILKTQGYDKEVDLWSIGVITYILLCGFPPFYNDNIAELFEQIMRADYDFPHEYWHSISKEAKDFVSKLLVAEPSERMTSQDALKHPWLNGKSSGNLDEKAFKKLSNSIVQHKNNSKVFNGEMNY
jgi:calcium/calmodulin-dependent protein kinase I